MTGPDMGRVELRIGGERRTLYYTIGAVRTLQRVLDPETDDLQSALRLCQTHMTTSSLAAFVWAGLLHEDREADLDKVREWVDWVPGEAIMDVYTAVNVAWTLSVMGSEEDPESSKKAGTRRRSLGLGRLHLASRLLKSMQGLTSSGGTGRGQTSSPGHSDDSGSTSEERS